MTEGQQSEEVEHVSVAAPDGLQQLRVEELELRLVLRVVGEIERLSALRDVIRSILYVTSWIEDGSRKNVLDRDNSYGPCAYISILLRRVSGGRYT